MSVEEFPAQVALHDATADPQSLEHRTRDRILDLIMGDGPISAADLAAELEITPTAVRRHLTNLTEQGLIETFEAKSGARGRGRPARRYVSTNQAQKALPGHYSEIANRALHFLAEIAGPEAVTEFAQKRVQELENVLTPDVDSPNVAERVNQLAQALAEEGYMASTRPVPGSDAVQLCQGYCPVQEVAAEFPELCEAETKVFSRILGVHVQRLSTMAAGAHVCTTHIPTSVITPRSTHVEGSK